MWQSYLHKYKSIFLNNPHADKIQLLSTHKQKDIQIHSIVGNHDINYHNVTNFWFKLRFEKSFQSPSVDLVTVNNIHFVTINSIIMSRNDGCHLCSEVEKRLEQVSMLLECSRNRQKIDSHKAFQNCSKLELLKK